MAIRVTYCSSHRENHTRNAFEQRQQIKHRHNLFNHLITILLSAFVCSIGFLLWMTEVPLLDGYKPGTGLIIVGLATIFYKTPYFSYLLNRRHFANDKVMMHLIGKNWQEYKMRILSV